YRAFGNVTKTQERFYDSRHWLWFDHLCQDVRYAARILRRSPGFAAVAILTLALGIGANTAIFSVVNAVLLRSLPFPDTQRIVVLGGNATPILNHLGDSPPVNAQGGVSIAAAEQMDPVSWRTHVHSFEAVAAYHPGNVNLTGEGGPESVHAAQITPEFFRVLGVAPALGQDFSVDAHGAATGVVLSWSLWQERYHSDANIVGKPVVVNARPITVLGVMPRGFQFPAGTEIWVPRGVGDDTIDRGVIFTDLIGRLRRGTSFAEAQAEMNVITERVRNEDSLFRKLGGPGVVLMRLQDNLTENSRTVLLLLLGAVGCVLLIACANVANLVLSRSMNRQREVAVRSAMGAGRARLIRQLLTENVLLALMGGSLSVLLAFWSLRFLIAELPVALPTLTPIAIDGRVLAFTALLSCGVGLLFGLAPAWAATKIDLSNSLKDGLAIPGTRGHARIRGALLVTQIALSVVLSTGAGLMVRTLVRLLDVQPGFDGGQVLTLNISLPDAAYHAGPQITDYFDQVFRRLKSLPGVESVGAINYVPLGQSPSFALLVSTERRPINPDHPFDSAASFFVVSGDYFRTLRIPLLKGRYFSDQDSHAATRVAIISESLANYLWPGQDPVGRQFSTGQAYLVVGVVGNVHHSSLGQSKEMEMYFPQQQSPTASMDLVIRTSGDPSAMAKSIRGEILVVDKNQPIAAVRTMKAVVDDSLSSQWSHMFLLGIFALLALILAAIGCYAVVAYSVAQRTHEIGVRMALGARGADVLRLVLGHGMHFILIGVAVGVGGALALTRLLATMLFGVSATDPLTFAGVAILLTLVSLAACYIPARRAMRVDPMVALRHE
ncbi:MAG: ABC transporter permease, partial [Candidatus Acidiferrales bacterium]